HAVVLSLDEKSQIQALDRTQPGLPMKKGRCATMTTTTSATVPPPCSPPSTSGKARSSGAACSVTGTRNSSAFSMPSNAKYRPTRRSMWSSTITPPTSTPRCAAGSHPSPRHLPLHADLVLLGQRGRRLVCQAHPPTAQARRLHLDRRVADRHQPLHRRCQRQAQALRLDQIRRRHPRRCPTRETSV